MEASWTEWTDNEFLDYDLRKLKVDQAYLEVTNSADKPFYLYWRSDECVKCAFKKLRHIQKTVSADVPSIARIELDVARNLDLWMSKKDEGPYLVPNNSDDINYSSRPDVGQFGVYNLIISASEAIQFETEKEPVNIYTCM
jgi:hypothetical protein